MICIRHTDGTVTPVETGKFVEIHDMDGNIGMVIFRPGESAMLHTILPEDGDAERYTALFGDAKFSNTIEISNALRTRSNHSRAGSGRG